VEKLIHCLVQVVSGRRRLGGQCHQQCPAQHQRPTTTIIIRLRAQHRRHRDPPTLQRIIIGNDDRHRPVSRHPQPSDRLSGNPWPVYRLDIGSCTHPGRNLHPQRLRRARNVTRT
jgi:hypothetical protein